LRYQQLRSVVLHRKKTSPFRHPLLKLFGRSLDRPFFWPGGSGCCGTKSPPTPLPLLSPGGKAICPTIRRSAGTAFSRRCGGRSFPQHAGAKNLAKTSPLEFIQQVRTETSKVTWPTRRETVMTGVMVVIMTTILAVFFFGVDSILQAIVTMLLKLAQ
jgi:preprotein translocase subunit SecE